MKHPGSTRQFVRLAAASTLPLLAAAAGGCVTSAAEGELDRRGTAVADGQFRQILDNVAAFRANPRTLPRHTILVHGTALVRDGAGVGADDYLLSFRHEQEVRWEVSPLNDPDDLERVRLLYQWTTGFLTYDALRAKWDAHEAVHAAAGRATVRLPVNGEMAADWHTDDRTKAAAGATMGGTVTHPVWIRDVGGAADFAMALIRAMPNTRGRGRTAGRPSE